MIHIYRLLAGLTIIVAIIIAVVVKIAGTPILVWSICAGVAYTVGTIALNRVKDKFFPCPQETNKAVEQNKHRNMI